MKAPITCLIFLIVLWGLNAQTTATFESFELPPGTFLNGNDNSGGFSDGNIFLPNTYDPDYDFWSGWAISSVTDTLTPGFANQYSAIAGSGYEGSTTYAVTFAAPSSDLILTGPAQGSTAQSLYVTNSTYAYLSMLNGDSFAKKFGGETGDDPDFFLLTIKKYLEGELGADSINFYLADFRFEDNSQDYIVKDWTFIDLSGLGFADSLQFSLSSSDVGQFGINTPTYFCLDQVSTTNSPSPVKDYRTDLAVKVFPNPTSDRVVVNWQESTGGNLLLYDAAGRELLQRTLHPGDNSIDLENFPIGNYFLTLKSKNGWMSQKLIRQ